MPGSHRSLSWIPGAVLGLAMLDAVAGLFFLGLPASLRYLAGGILLTTGLLASLILVVEVATRLLPLGSRSAARLAGVVAVAVVLVLLDLGSGGQERLGLRTSGLAIALGAGAGGWLLRTAHLSDRVVTERYLHRFARSAPLLCATALLVIWAWRAHFTPLLTGGLIALAGIAALAILRPDASAWYYAAPTLFVGLLALALARPGGTADGRTPSNTRTGSQTVVLVTIDTLRFDQSPCDMPAATRPALARFCSEATAYRHAVAAAPWTLPSLGSILTGLPVSVHGLAAPETYLPVEVPTVAAALERAGFATGAFANSPFLPGSGLDRGFREAQIFPLSSRRVTLADRLLLPLEPSWNCWPAREVTDAGLNERAVRWLRHQQGEAVFLWVHYFAPHQPYEPPLRLLPAVPVDSRVGHRFSRFTAVRTGLFAPTAAEKAWIATLYRGEVARTAENLDDLLATLILLDRYDDATIVVTADHGEELWDHGGYEHGHTLFDELLRVPLLVRGPAAVPVGEQTAPVPAWTVAASALLDGAGLRFPAHLATAGEHRAPLIHSGWCLYYGPCEGLTFTDAGTWKYVVEPDASRERLFDLIADPGERRSVAGERPEVLADARTELAAQRSEEERLRRRLGIPDPVPHALDSTLRERLRALGYIR